MHQVSVSEAVNDHDVPRSDPSNPIIEKCDLVERLDRHRSLLKESRGHFPDYELKLRLLADFFAEHEAPVDIAIILNSGLSYMKQLAPYVEGHNVIYYRPTLSYEHGEVPMHVVGELHPDRTVLLFDNDMATGRHLESALQDFLAWGYSRNNIHTYLSEGCVKHGQGEAMIGHIDEILQERTFSLD